MKVADSEEKVETGEHDCPCDVVDEENGATEPCDEEDLDLDQDGDKGDYVPETEKSIEANRFQWNSGTCPPDRTKGNQFSIWPDTGYRFLIAQHFTRLST